MNFKKVARQLVVVGVAGAVFSAGAASVAAGHASTRRAAAGRIFRHALDDIKAEYGLDIYEFKPIHSIEQLGAHESRLHGPIIRMRVAAVDASDAGEPYFTTSWRIVNDRLVAVFHSSRDMRGCWIPGVSCATDCIKTFAIKHTVRLFRGTQLCVVRPLEFRYTDVPPAPADMSVRVTQVMLFDHDRHIDSGEARGLVVDAEEAPGKAPVPYLRRAVGDEQPTVFSLRYRDDSANGVHASQWHLSGYYAKNHTIVYHQDVRLERRFRRGHGPAETSGAGTGV